MEVKAVRVKKVLAVQAHDGNSLALVVDGEDAGPIGLIFDAEGAEAAAEQMLVMLPPKPDTEIGLTLPEGMTGPIAVESVDVAAPQGDGPFVVRFQIGELTAELHLPHLEALRWSRFLAAQIAAHHRKIRN